MNHTRTNAALVVCAAVALGLANAGCVAGTQSTPPRGMIVSGPPPAPLVETRPPPPAATSAWVAGYWHWNGATYTWIPGHWEAAPPGTVWYGPSYTAASDGRFFYEPGAFRPGAAPPPKVTPTANALR